MTVGEKIQYYRKKIGLSQEELGQKILVSRQTISLWEMDKTLPTIDNLLLLKEIFGVSVDDILSDAEPVEESKDEPREAYTFQYTKDDLLEVFKQLRTPFIKRAIRSTLACAVLFIFLVAAEAPDLLIGFVLGYLLISIVIQINGYRAYKKACLPTENIFPKNTYSYSIYDQHFMLNIIRNEETARTQKVYFDDIKKVESLKNHIILNISDQIFIIKKEILVENSVFFSLGERKCENNDSKKPTDRLKVVSVILLILSIVTIWGGLLGVGILSAFNQAMTENMWVFFLFLTVPIASIAFGFYLKKKGYKYKPNVIVGVIMAVLLCIYGSFTFIFADLYSHSDEPIINAEQVLGIDIPEHSRINTMDKTTGNQSMPRGYVFYTSDIYFDNAVAEEFEKDLPNDSKWITEIPNDLVGVSSYYCEVIASDYYIICNKDTGEFNKLPSESGTYVFINILYNAKDNTMKLVEYRIEYVK